MVGGSVVVVVAVAVEAVVESRVVVVDVVVVVVAVEAVVVVVDGSIVVVVLGAALIRQRNTNVRLTQDVNGLWILENSCSHARGCAGRPLLANIPELLYLPQFAAEVK